jgi:hypothetical protein
MHEIEEQATKAWGSSKPALAAWDFMRVLIPAIIDNTSDPSSAVNWDANATSTAAAAEMTTTQEQTMALQHADPVEGYLYTSKRPYDSNNKKRRR